MGQPQHSQSRPVPGAPPHVWKVRQVGGAYAFRIAVALVVAGIGAFTVHGGMVVHSWLLAGVGLALMLGVGHDTLRFRKDRLLQVARGYVLQFDREGIRFLDLALVRWPSVRSLALQDLRYGKGWAAFLLVELEPGEFGSIAQTASTSRVNHREIVADAGRSTIALNLRSLEDEPSSILDMGRQFLSVHAREQPVFSHAVEASA